MYRRIGRLCVSLSAVGVGTFFGVSYERHRIRLTIQKLEAALPTTPPFGFQGQCSVVKGTEQSLSPRSYYVSFNRRTRVANWVYECLDKDTQQEKEYERPNVSMDKSIHPYYAATDEDYASQSKYMYGSVVYEKGHLAAAANHKSDKTDWDQTFLYSNIAPQVSDPPL